jgi:hypothetical protein
MVICIYLVMALVAVYHFNCTKFGKKFKARLLQERNVPEFVWLVAIVSPIFFPIYWVLVLIVFLIFRYERKHNITRFS